jgi:5-methylcytosine-specific restriction endonuclease McrA
MFNCEQDPLALLIELTPKLAKKRYRQSIYDAWDNKCGYCGDPATSLDHIIPRFCSGSNNRNNLLPACRRCNANKASAKMEDWYRQQSYFTEENLDKIKVWMSQETIDIFMYSVNEPINRLAVS